MTISLEQMAAELTVSPAELQQRSLRAFADLELRLVNLDIADLQDRYGVRTAAELQMRIQQGHIYAHPAWEESIEWEQLEAYRARFEAWALELGQQDV